MSVITPWTAVYPADTPAAILGNLPMKQGTVSYAVPTSVVPADAGGILVFAWCAITGSNPGTGYWHVSVNLSGGGANFFSVMVVGAPHLERPILFNSQAFWLPMPSDGNVNVTLAGADFPGSGNEGEVEIHGYLPAAMSTDRS